MTAEMARLEQVLALSEAMVSAAAAADWEALASREAERRALAASLSALLPDEATARSRPLIEACLRCDARTRPLVVQRMNELRVVLRTTRNGT